jgi:hypothetical protein
MIGRLFLGSFREKEPRGNQEGGSLNGNTAYRAPGAD